MYVKSLSLKGFKSFADPVTLDLLPGVNVVVGPNGSGKSNVIDAVAWVLGAQGASRLRGGKMDDVIFAGTGKRQSLGRAEVALTIDNSDHRIPVEFSEVTITRTLFRTGESEYAINGVNCRLLDIQELLSDSGVGRQQHVIVSQGNLDAVLSARPEERRMIIEEAAGVLKFRKRREKSQRRLQSTEADLERLADLVREVRQQLRPLQKQAEAAERHEHVVVELAALRLYSMGRDIASLRSREADCKRETSENDRRASELKFRVESSGRDVLEAESSLSSLVDDDLAERIERLEGIFHRARGMSALMAERRRSLQRDLDASVSRDVVASLEADAANVRGELEQVNEDRRSLPEPFDEVARSEAHLASEWLSFEEQWGDGLPVASNEAAEVRGEATALRKNLDSIRNEVEDRSNRLQSFRTQSEEVATQLGSVRSRADEAVNAHEPLQEQLEDLLARVERAVSTEDKATQFHRNAEQARSVAVARAEALEQSLSATRARAGVEQLSEVNGVVGTVSDLVDVDEGFEAAFEAAAGEAMAAVVVDSTAAACRAIERLQAGDLQGAVLVLDANPPDPVDVEGTTPMRHRVRGRSSESQRLIDLVLGSAVVVNGDWRSAIDIALSNPDAVVVTRQGDRFSKAGWRIGGSKGGVTAAAVELAQAEAFEAKESLDAHSSKVEEARCAHRELAAQVKSVQSQLHDNERVRSRTEGELQRLEQRGVDLAEEIASVEDNIALLQRRQGEDSQRLESLEQRLPALEAAEANSAERAREWREQRSVLEDKSSDLRNRRNELEVRAASLEEREQFLSGRLEALEAKLTQHERDVAAAAERRMRIQHSLDVLGRLAIFTQQRTTVVEDELAKARAKRSVEREKRAALTTHLEAMRADKARLEAQSNELGEQRQQLELRAAEVRLRLESLLETLSNELQTNETVATSAERPEVPDSQTPKQRIADLERELRQMGPVNPLALDEFKAVQERHDFLDQQFQDVQKSRRELLSVIRSVDQEIMSVFTEAYNDVAKNFEQLFGMLFPGGGGGLRLTDPENMLETGIEIEARPSGKNVRTLSLLSGGERSLAAVAFLFAVFRSRPSPFYLLDEVEAALDDINLSRFLSLVDEFRNEAQLVIVSHQKRTMERADTIYGVSMQPGGSTKVVSERVHVDITESSLQARSQEPADSETAV